MSGFKGKKNVYLCEKCGWGFVSLDVDEGTTPMFTGCPRDGCKGTAASFMYRVPQELLADVTPVIEWFHPTPDEYAQLSPAMQNHVDTFRLIQRRAEHG